MEHRLKIKSLHDAQAECSCGWRMVHTGSMTKEDILKEYKRHKRTHMKIQITGEEQTGKTIYTALTVSVETEGKLYCLETILVETHASNPDSTSFEVVDTTWLTQPPEDAVKEIDIEEAVEKYILRAEKGERSNI